VREGDGAITRVWQKREGELMAHICVVVVDYFDPQRRTAGRSATSMSVFVVVHSSYSIRTVSTKMLTIEAVLYGTRWFLSPTKTTPTEATTTASSREQIHQSLGVKTGKSHCLFLVPITTIQIDHSYSGPISGNVSRFPGR
jgi:hypothetical protein